jgi:hypothetical protein
LVQKAIKEKNIGALIKFLKLCETFEVIKPPAPECKGGVITAPKGSNFQEWLKAKVKPAQPTDE